MLVVHQNILKNEEKNVETHFAYEDGDSDYDHMDVTHVEIVIFFVKPNGSIDHLIGDESVKKYIFLYYVFNFKTMLYICFVFHIAYI